MTKMRFHGSFRHVLEHVLKQVADMIIGERIQDMTAGAPGAGYFVS